MITEIKSGKKIFALVFDLASLKEGTFPVTNPLWPLQLLLMKRKKGHVVAKHTHKKIRKFSQQPQEAIIVIKGSIQASIFNNRGKIIAKKNISAGQCLLMADGAHEVKITKNALIYAFKDGPYVDDKVFLK
ncbi:MAG: hypothetical protein AAB797_01130 [Patescibacteria group bacterium]